MAKAQLDMEYHENTIDENKSILFKLRGRSSKIDNKTSYEWSKLFAKLNDINNNNNNINGRKLKSTIKKSCVTQQDQAVHDLFYGPIQGFPSGHWWGIRMDCSRDQVHIPFDKNIQDGPFGVVSICTSHLNTTNDVDLGTLLTFTGGEYTSNKMDDPLMRNLRNNIPLRLVRGYNLANEFAPQTGYRYDGLYIVISSWISISSDSKKYCKFALARLNCQETPPWSMSRKRMSQRISTIVRDPSATTGSCRTLRCHMHGCQTQEPEKKRKKIIHSNQSSTNEIHVNRVYSNKLPDVQRNIKESKIVMRHVSNKCDPIVTGAGHNINFHGVESPTQVGNLMLPCSPKLPVCKLQNANISIRTELYDSSPNPQQDIKKITPMTFCRVYNTNRVPAARIIGSHTSNPVGTINLNAFGPCTKGKINQESQIQLRSSVNRVSDNTSVDNATSYTLENTRTNDRNSEKSNNSTSINDVLLKNIPLVCNTINNINFLNVKPKIELTRLKIDDEENLNYDVNNKVEYPNEFDNNSRSTRSSRRSSCTSLSSTESLIKKLQLPEAVVSIESMTPEQMLNLIVKKRYNPTGKLLIGSIIGLPTEDVSQTLKNPSKLTNNSGCNSNLKSNVESKTTDTQEASGEKQKFNSINKYYEIQSSSTLKSSKRIGNENIDRRMRFMRLKCSRVAKALAPIKDSTINQNENSSKRLNKTHTNDKMTQPFFKSTKIRRRRGELANLVIDANFPIKIRSHAIQTRTMSKRLRSTSIVLSKRKEFKGFITNYPRVDLSKKNKLLKNRKKTITKNRLIQKKKCEEKIQNIRCNTPKPIEPNENNKIKNSISQRDNKLLQKIERSKSRMVDAMIQCTLQKEISTSIEKNCDKRNNRLMEVEWVDLTDVESKNSGNEQLKKVVYRNSQVQTPSDDIEILQIISQTNKQTSKEILNTRKRIINNKSLSINNTIDSLSAFVPVNLPDGELRIARLRSIGFKPIESSVVNSNEISNIYNNNRDIIRSNDNKPTVIRRNVDEQYNKYTSEENNVVGYMDHELHYQDIEAEACELQKMNDIHKRKCTKVQGKKMIKHNIPCRRTKRKLRKTSLGQEMNEDNVDLDEETGPWLGWSSYVTTR